MYIQRTIETLLPGSRYASLFAKAEPEDGLLLCLADGERQMCRGVNAIGVEEYLRMLQKRLAV